MARFIVDITHPAHAHFFRHPIGELLRRGHEVLVTSRRKEMATDLLDAFGVAHDPLAVPAGGGIAGLLAELVRRDLALARIARRFHPAAIAAIGGIFAAHAARLARSRSVVFYDTENARLQNLLTYPVASTVVAPRCYEGWLPRGAVRYPGYHELAYLHPARFTPERDIALDNGLAPEGDTFLVRVVAWQASHDIGERGWSPALLRAVVAHLAERGRVLVSAEGELPADLEAHRYPGDPARIHHVMAFCRLYAGESATMASEAAVLGVPAVYAAETGRGYTNEQERRYGLVGNVRRLEPDAVTGAMDSLLETGPEAWTQARRRLLDECVDVAAFAADEIERRGGETPAAT